MAHSDDDILICNAGSSSLKLARWSPLENLSILLDEKKNMHAEGFASLHTDNSETEVWLTPVDEMHEMLDQFVRYKQSKEEK